MNPRLCNPLLVEPQISRRLRDHEQITTTRLCTLRIEPAFVYKKTELVCRWRVGHHIFFEENRQISRNNVAIFFTVPAFSESTSIIGEIWIGENLEFETTLNFNDLPCSRLESAEFARVSAGRFDGARYDLQSLPFSTMLRQAGQIVRERNCKLIMITGSVGKTTTKELLSHALEQRFAVCRSTDSWNLPHEICSQIMLNADWAEVFVLEVAVDGHMSELAKHIIPDHLVFTHLGQVHTAYSKDISVIGNLKASLATYMSDTGVVTYNADIPEIAECLDQALTHNSHPPRLHAVGAAPSCRIHCTSGNEGFIIEDRRTESNITVITERKSLHENIVGLVVSVWMEFDLPVSNAIAAISSFPGVPFRMSESYFDKTLLLSDCYNANPLSMRGLLRRVSELRTTGCSSCLILGEMLDLGELEIFQHEELITAIEEVADAAILVGTRYERATNWNGEGRHWFPSIEILLQSGLLEQYAGKYEVIAVKGSYRTGMMRVAMRLSDILAGRTYI
jgi:UDP-N-acetylmuramoyl-tripeptide--D-alanyl-D-alanine ligase